MKRFYQIAKWWLILISIPLLSGVICGLSASDAGFGVLSAIVIVACIPIALFLFRVFPEKKKDSAMRLIVNFKPKYKHTLIEGKCQADFIQIILGFMAEVFHSAVLEGVSKDSVPVVDKDLTYIYEYIDALTVAKDQIECLACRESIEYHLLVYNEQLKWLKSRFELLNRKLPKKIIQK